MKSKQNNSSKNQDLWITSYADLISAIFAVMVLFVSFSKIDIEKFDMIQRLMVEKKKQEFDNFKTLENIQQIITEIAKNRAIPPKLGIFLSWELLCPGSSIKFFLLEIFIMVGIE